MQWGRAAAGMGTSFPSAVRKIKQRQSVTIWSGCLAYLMATPEDAEANCSQHPRVGHPCVRLSPREVEKSLLYVTVIPLIPGAWGTYTHRFGKSKFSVT
jgi:hypothetical protein